ncbi:MAG TPA: hypothetical protein VMW63_00910 [Methanoregulaceae archaeon]|nr:hypothetical protein [Methanoregulaceae archaeon]
MAKIGQPAVDYIIFAFEDRGAQDRIAAVRPLAEISPPGSSFLLCNYCWTITGVSGVTRMKTVL